jgi:uncharacterized protein
LKIEVDVDAAYDTIDDLISKIKIKLRHIYNLLLKIVSRLLNPAISNETLQKPNQSGCKFHPGFATNLGQLLLAPIRRKVLAIDPGFRSGCKIVCLDEKGIYCIMKLFTHMLRKRGDYGDEKIRSMVNSYKIDAISIGNGTASHGQSFYKENCVR